MANTVQAQHRRGKKTGYKNNKNSATAKVINRSTFEGCTLSTADLMGVGFLANSMDLSFRYRGGLPSCGQTWTTM